VALARLSNLWLFFGIAAAIWLPWLVITKRHWRAGRSDEGDAPDAD
jgi:hypothetical protein